MSGMVLLSVKQEYSSVLIRKYEESIKFWSQILEKWSNSKFCRERYFKTTKHLHFNHLKWYQKKLKIAWLHWNRWKWCVVLFFLSGSHLMFCFSGRKSAVILNAPFALRWDIWRIFISPDISKSCQAEQDYRGFTLETLCKLYAECR